MLVQLDTLRQARPVVLTCTFSILSYATDAHVSSYGYDGYPLGFDCANPYTWPDGNLPTDRNTLHEQQSPNTPHSVLEFQGGSFDPWGGLGFDQCSELLNHEFERVFYKNNYGFGITLLNIYMVITVAGDYLFGLIANTLEDFWWHKLGQFG